MVNRKWKELFSIDGLFTIDRLFTIYDLPFTMAAANLSGTQVARKTSHAVFEFGYRSGRTMSEPKTSDTPKDLSDNRISNDRSVTDVVADYEAQLDDVAELVARVRHEINNPLAGILGQAQLLLREELNDKARRRAETIEQLAARLRDVVAQLRQIQRPVKGVGSD